MDDFNLAAQSVGQPKGLTSSEEITHRIDVLRHLIEQVKDLNRDTLRADDAVKQGGESPRLSDEAVQFHMRREVVITERHLRESIAEIFGKSSSEARKYQHHRINATSKAGIEQTVSALENLIFHLEHKRLELIGGAQQQTARHNPDIDPLTDLYSRRLFDRYFVQELDRSQRYGYPCTLLFLALRNWRTVHTAHGLSVSNAVLVRMACACKAVMRGYDYGSRLAEDEFAVLLPQSDNQGGRTVCRRIAEKFEQSIGQLSPDLKLKLEFGVATFPFDGETLTSLFYMASAHRMTFTPDMCDIHMPL